jgi:hypothetical protein
LPMLAPEYGFAGSVGRLRKNPSLRSVNYLNVSEVFRRPLMKAG